MRADLVLEGGGVKGIGLVGAIRALEAQGYEFPRLAGTSAGALVAALVAAGARGDELHALMDDLDYEAFADPGLLDRFGVPGKLASVVLQQGIYEGDALRDWIAARLDERGVRTFADLRLPDDPDGDLPAERAYRLVVTASDLGRGRLVRLPWDYPDYGLDPDEQLVADAVRASTSIPFYYEPVRMRGGRGYEHVLVDGGMLSNFPVDTFDRTDGRRPRWPTLGIKLSARPDSAQRPEPIGNTFEFSKALVTTMIGFHDQLHLDDPCVVARTIFVDTMKVRATDFDLDDATARALHDNGRAAAERFLADWDFDAYLTECRS